MLFIFLKVRGLEGLEVEGFEGPAGLKGSNGEGTLVREGALVHLPSPVSFPHSIASTVQDPQPLQPQDLQPQDLQPQVFLFSQSLQQKTIKTTIIRSVPSPTPVLVA